MIARPSARSILLGMILAASVAVALMLSGCGGDSTEATTPEGMTALQALQVAKKSIEPVAPDAKLLIVTTAQVVEPTATPVWQFLLGSPKTNMTYAVIVNEGQPMASPYTTATLTPGQWAALPDVADIKIDSDEAHRKALKAYPDGSDHIYVINLATGEPGVPTSGLTTPMSWVVMFDPTRASGEQTSTVQIDASTGKVTIPK